MMSKEDSPTLPSGSLEVGSDRSIVSEHEIQTNLLEKLQIAIAATAETKREGTIDTTIDKFEAENSANEDPKIVEKEGNLDAGETKEEPSEIDWLRGELENLRAQLEHVQDDIEKGKCKFQDLAFTLFSQTNTYP
jgi:hypothetical protein